MIADVANGNGRLATAQSCTEAQLKRDLARFSRWLARLGFMPGTAGNLSVRLGADRFLVTPTGLSKALLNPSDMTLVNSDGQQLAGERRVTSELGMHLAVYRHRADAGAVVHAHPPVATAFACAGRGLEAMLCQEAAMTLGSVPLAKYATTGTEEVAASLVPHLPLHEAVLMANHGAVSYGKTLLDAFLKMETLEHLARIHLVAHQLGSPQHLEQEQLDRLSCAKAHYLRNTL